MIDACRAPSPFHFPFVIRHFSFAVSQQGHTHERPDKMTNEKCQMKTENLKPPGAYPRLVH